MKSLPTTQLAVNLQQNVIKKNPQSKRQSRQLKTRIHSSSNDTENDSNNKSTPSQPTSLPPIGDPVQMINWGGSLPSPRRAALGGLAGLSIALGGNLFGITSFLLGLDDGKTAQQLHLDQIIPIKGYKRCIDFQNGFEFLYPSQWLADQRLYQRYAERLEREVGLDPPSLQRARRRQSQGVEPSAAFGPPGSTGEDNISVIVASIRDGFSLERTLGTPREAAERFLNSTVAPPGSNKIATLIDAGSRRDPLDNELYYFLEFTVESTTNGWKRHNIAVYGARNGLLYTLNAQTAASRWTQEREEQFKRAAGTFRIISSGAGASGFPDRI